MSKGELYGNIGVLRILVRGVYMMFVLNYYIGPTTYGYIIICGYFISICVSLIVWGRSFAF